MQFPRIVKAFAAQTSGPLGWQNWTQVEVRSRSARRMPCGALNYTRRPRTRAIFGRAPVGDIGQFPCLMFMKVPVGVQSSGVIHRWFLPEDTLRRFENGMLRVANGVYRVRTRSRPRLLDVPNARPMRHHHTVLTIARANRLSLRIEVIKPVV